MQAVYMGALGGPVDATVGQCTNLTNDATARRQCTDQVR